MAETNSNNQELPKESTPEKKPIMDESLTKDPTKTNGIDDKSITDPLNEVKETDTKDADILKNDHISDSENHKASPIMFKHSVENELRPIEDTNSKITQEDSLPTRSKKPKIQSTEIVDGLEMCVEYGSETPSSESEAETKFQPTVEMAVSNLMKVEEDDQLLHKPAKKKRFSKRIRDKSPRNSDSDEKSDDKLSDELKKPIIDFDVKDGISSPDNSDMNLLERLKLLKPPKLQLSENGDRIQKLKKMLHTTGLMFPSYRKPFNLQDTDEKRIQYLEGLLKNRGIEGNPTFTKCREIRRKLESQKEAADLDPKNIFEGRRTRPKKFVNMKKYESDKRDNMRLSKNAQDLGENDSDDSEQ